MSKKRYISFLILAILLAWLFDVFIGRSLAAKLSTWPVLNRLHVLSPQAPIVITNHETVRVADSGDLTQTSSQIKSKLSTMVWVGGQADIVAGAAVNLTSDGSFVTGQGAFSRTGGQYYVVLNDGHSAQVSAQAPDPATGLVFFKAGLSGVAVANTDSSAGLAAGQKLAFSANSIQNFANKIQEVYVTAAQGDFAGQNWQADYPSRSFAVSAAGALLPGEAAVDENANVVGVWNGSRLISSDVLKTAMNLFFANGQKIIRPSFGFGYTMITANESQLTGQAQGARVVEVDPASPAKSAGLAAGDIIVSVGGQAVSEAAPLEPLLEAFAPGQQAALRVVRKGQDLDLTLIAGELK
ncbi:MAG TPA: PDZ domain-containing protein [Patescibacteria group bacterium]|nr:PDZ domain-containing protein [Patescibacteria group bacterium]